MALRPLLLAAAMLGAASLAPAGEIDVMLELDYANGSSASGGAWRLVARSDGFGIFSLRVGIEGINSSVTAAGPTGRVNGSATDNAGFTTFANVSQAGYRDLLFGQSLTTIGQGQQGAFYGVGTLSNGSPVFPGQQVGTSAIGPNLTTLTAVENVPWATDTAWAAGAVLASGTFAAGDRPAFVDAARFEGQVFSSVGTATEPGERDGLIDFTTVVIDDLTFGVGTGDYNNDGLVDAADYVVYRNLFDQSVTPLTAADGDGDGLIGPGDLAVWKLNYGRSAPALAASAAIPEPASLVVLLTAVAASLAPGRLQVPRKNRQDEEVA